MAAAAAAAAAAGPGPAEAPAAAPELKSRFRTREGSYRLLGPATAAAAAAASAGPAAAGPAPPGPGALPPVRLSMVRLARSRSPPGGAAERSRVCCNLGRELHFYVPGPAPAHRQARVQGHPAHVPRLQPVHGGRRDAGAARRLLGRTGAVPGPGQEGQRRTALQRGAPHRQVQGDAGQVAAGHGAPVPGVPRQRPPVPVRLGAAVRGQQPSVHAAHAGRGLPGVLLQEQDPPQPPPQVGGGLGAPERVRLLAGRALAGLREPGRGAQGVPLLLHAAAGDDEELFRGAPLRLLEPRRPLRGHRRRGRPGHRVVVRRGPRGGPRARPQVVGQRGGVRSFHASPAAALRGSRRGRGGEGGRPRRPPRGPQRHLPLRLGRPGHAVLPVGPHRGRAGPSAAPSPLPRPSPPGVAPGLPRSLSRSNSLPQPGGGPQISSPRVPPSVGRFATLTLRDPRGPPEKEHKRYHSLGNISRGGGGADRPAGGPGGGSRGSLDMAKVLGTALCPRLHEVPLLEPLVCKKIAQERLTVLLFLEDCIVTACQEGLICTWARPGVSGLSSQNGGSPSGTVV